MHMHKPLSLVIFAGLMLTCVSSSAQGSNIELEFDCGTIAPNGSGAMVYQDFGRGFRFEFPGDWKGSKLFLSSPGTAAEILVNPMIASSDPKFYVTEPAKPIGSETINGLTWTTLTWERGGRGYYKYSHGLAIEFFVSAFGKNKAVDPAALAALHQVLSTFTFFDDPYRLDRQLAALKVGQKLGDLTITRINPGAGGFEHPLATVKFAGQLTLTGNVVLPSPSMGGGWSPYFMYLDNESRSLVPQLKCPVESLAPDSEWTFRVDFTNQEFTNQQFAQVPSISGSHAWYDAEATVVVDHVSEAFGNGGMKPQVSARLVRVLRKKETQ
jgi:hypothetical protein